MRTTKMIWSLGLAGLLLLSGCGTGESVDGNAMNEADNSTLNESQQTSNNDEPKEETAEGEKEATRSDANGESERQQANIEIGTNGQAEDAPEDQGEVEVWIEGEVTVEDKTVTIEGRTNLLPGVKMQGKITAEGYSMFGYNDSADVHNDGTFTLEIKKPDIEGTMDIDVYFRPEHEEESAASVYGDKGEKLTGTYVSQYEALDEILQQAQAIASVAVDAETGTKMNLAAPGTDRPDDYGDTNVWIEPVVTYDDKYYYVDARSNLLQGTEVELTIDIPGKWHIGYSDRDDVRPDGTFDLQIENPEEELFYMFIRFKPDEYEWSTVKELYGERGENLQGDYVKTEQTNEGDIQIIEMKIEVQADPSEMQEDPSDA